MGPWIVLAAVLALAATVRFSALEFGGSVWAAHPDESNVIGTLDAMRHGGLTHFEVAYAGGYFYPLSAFLGTWKSIAAFPDAPGPADIFGHAFGEYVAARTWSALLATLTVWLVFVTGRRVGGAATGLAAAAIVSCAPLAVRDAHLAKADSACAFAVALLLAVVTSPSATRRHALAVGAVAGLAMSVKYAVGPLPAALLALARPRERALSRIGIGLLAAGCVAVALNAFWFSWPARAAHELVALAGEQRNVPQRAWLAPSAVHPLAYHARISLWHGCGPLVALLALPALVRGFRRGGTARLLALAILGQWLVLAVNPFTVARNFLPSVPPLAVLVAALAVEWTGRVPPAGRLLATTAVVAALVARPLADAVGIVRILHADDTRTAAARWMDANLPPGAVVQLVGAPRGAPEYGVPGLGLPLALSGRRPSSDGRGAEFLFWHHYPIPYSSERLPADGPTRTSLAVFDPFAGPARPVLEPLDAFYVPLARCGGVRAPGPRIEVFGLAPPAGGVATRRPLG